MHTKTFTTRKEAEAIHASIKVQSPDHQEVWLITSTNRNHIGTFTSSQEADAAATSALIGACYDFDGPFDPEAWNEVVQAVTSVGQINDPHQMTNTDFPTEDAE